MVKTELAILPTVRYSKAKINRDGTIINMTDIEVSDVSIDNAVKILENLKRKKT